MSGTFLRFLAVGGVAAAANWASCLAFARVMDLRWSVVAAYLVGMGVAFVLNRLFVFEPSGRPAWNELARFALVNVVALLQVWLVTIGLGRWLFPMIGFSWRPDAVAHAIGVLTPVATSYLGYRHFTFARAREFKPQVGARPPSPSPSPSTPLAVDLDGTLLRTDMLVECLVAGLVVAPLRTLKAFALLYQGKVRFKARLAEIAALDVGSLPARQALVRRLEEERAAGRRLHLVTAADHRLAKQVADRFGFFDSVEGSRDGVNLKGERKLAHLRATFPSGFAYAGDSPADLRVWTEAESILLAGAAPDVAARARSMNKPLEAEIDVGRPSVRVWLKALRLHQWSKNLLVFVPLLLGRVGDWQTAALTCLLGFLIMGVTASATYLINDLADLRADRAHPTKRFRPLAAGDLPVAHAVLAAPLMLAAATAASAALNPWFCLALLAYVGLTLAYSFRLKRKPVLDVHVLGALYTLRVVIGTVLSGARFSAWLFTFAFFFFTSLALAKRYAELSVSQAPPGSRIAGRGYSASDAQVTLALGMAASSASILVIVEYMMTEAFPSSVYARPLMLWATPVLVSLWASRIWLLAHRGDLTADPVEFAVRDRKSILLGLALGFVFLIARL